MVRVLVTGMVVGWVGVAAAGPTRKVSVESDPAGASVYLNDKEEGVKCKTPCTIDAPIGEATLIVELENHQQKFEALVIPRKGKVNKVSVKLEPSVGYIVVEGAKGATITVDDVDLGKAPNKVEASEGGHHVVVTLNGKTLYDAFLEVSTGNDTTVTPKSAGSSAPKPAASDPRPTRDPGTKPDVVGSAPASRPRARYLAVSAVLDVGFRHFTYEGVNTPQNLREESEGGQVIAGPLIELWLGRIAGIKFLGGLSAAGRFQFGLNSQPVTGNGIMNTTTTFWQSIEVSLRQRWIIGNSASIEVNGGYLRDQYRFNAANPADVDLVPDADYQSVRIGARASLLVGRFEPYVTAENRIVTSGGKLQERFAASGSASASGLRGALGIGAQFGAMSARVEASFAQYSWDFNVTAVMPKYDARSGSDSITQLSFGVGYSY